MVTETGCGGVTGSAVIVRMWVMESYENRVRAQSLATVNGMFAPPGAPPTP
jgi:hypothetical protein